MERPFAPVCSEAFVSLCSAAELEDDPTQRLALYQEAVSLCSPTTPPQLPPPSVLLSHLAEHGPLTPSLYQHLMACYLAFDRGTDAITIFQALVSQLFSSSGALPNEAAMALYHRAAQEDGTPSPAPKPAALREPAGPRHGAVCDFEFFRLLHQLQSRAPIHAGMPIHMVLLSLTQGAEAPSLRDDRLARLISLAAEELRQGDVLSPCTSGQLFLMLMQSTLEDSREVCRRIEARFREIGLPGSLQAIINPLAI